MFKKKKIKSCEKKNKTPTQTLWITSSLLSSPAKNNVSFIFNRKLFTSTLLIEPLPHIVETHSLFPASVNE